jgi:hypothetical protein
MEENKNQETTKEISNKGAVVICTALVIGYILGRASANQIAVESYRRGVSDTLNSIVFRH